MIRFFACLGPNLVWAVSFVLAIATTAAAEEPSGTEEDIDTVVSLFELVVDVDPDGAKPILQSLAGKAQNRELVGQRLASLKERLGPFIEKAVADSATPLHFDAACLGAAFHMPNAIAIAEKSAVDIAADRSQRARAIAAILSANATNAMKIAKVVLVDSKTPSELKASTIASLGLLEQPEVAGLLLEVYPTVSADDQPKIVELLTQRPVWGKALVAAVNEGTLKQDVLNVNQVGKLLASSDEELKEAVRQRWGSVRTERNPQREQVVVSMRAFLRSHFGNAARGRLVFDRVCGQCHKLHGVGQEVGPEITLNGRASFEQLLSNVFDPSLVIGAAYQPRTVATDDGRVLTGIVTEDNDQRVVLKMQGGKIETIPRDTIEEITVSQLSLMPEGLEKQLTPPEMADLWALITLDKAPSDAAAKLIPGAPVDDSPQWQPAVDQVAQGWRAFAMGEAGAEIEPTLRGRKGVLRTHPLDQNSPAILQRTVDVPAKGKTVLKVVVSHHEQGDWQLATVIDGEVVSREEISSQTAKEGWCEVTVDLSPYAGKTVEVQLQNVPTGWSWEFGYWSKIEIVTTP
jgi:putative heme-binding domain-containing protein